jgi:tetratricopeptide (TPR) repeat protein/nucleoside phosphorylase
MSIVQHLTAEQALEFQGKVELLLVTATDTETTALEGALKPLSGLDAVALTHIENHTYRLGTFAAFSAVHVQCVMGTRAAGSAMDATTEAVRCWTPRAVIMPGIAWGSPRVKGAGLADVLVASSVQDFENARVGTTHLFRSPETEAGVKLLDRFRSVTDWIVELPDGRRSSRRLGLLLSGDKLIANAAFRDRLLDTFDRAIGGDMESYGVAQACRGLGVEWIVAKGICDWGDEGKDKIWQQAAAQASVSFCVAALSHPSALHGLGQGPRRDAVPMVMTRDGAEPPNEIPVTTDRLVGRNSELATLVASLTSASDGTTLCLLVGMGGIGKSFLAAAAARVLFAKGLFPDGIIWHDTYDESPVQVMAHVLSALGAGAASLELSAVQVEYRRAVRNRRVLIVVDNAVAPTQVSALLTDSPGSAVLVTSRNHMPALKSRAAGLIDLKRMRPDDAIELLQYKSGPLPEQQTALHNVASLCGHLPLALSIAGSLLGEREMWPSVESLEKRLYTRRLDCLTIEGCPDLDVRAVLLVSYERMDAALAKVFRSLSVLGRTSFGASAVSYMMAHDKEATIADLARLIGRSVLERSSYGRYVLHDLLRDLAGELALTDEPPDLVATLRQRAVKYWETWREYWQLGGLAAESARKGNADEALEYYQKAMTLNETVGDRQGRARSLGGIAAAWAKKGNADKALDYFDKALALNKEIGDRHGLAMSLGGIASAWAKKGNATEAIEYFGKAQALNEEIGDRHGLAMSFGGIASAWAKKGNATKAIEYFGKAQVLNEEMGDRQGQASAHGGIAAAWAKQGDATRAIEYFGKAQALNEEIGDQHGQAHALGGIAAAYAKKGDADKAIEFHAKAQALSEKIGDWKGQAHALGGIAAAYAKKGDADKAIEFHAKAQALSEKIGDWKGQAHALGGIAAAYAKKGDAVKAIEYFERAQAFNQKIGDRHGQAHALGGLAAIYARKGNADKAIEYHEKAQALSKEIGDWKGQARALGGIAGVFARMGDRRRAIEHYKKALELDEAVGDSRYIIATLSALLKLARSVKDDVLAEFCLSRLARE